MVNATAKVVRFHEAGDAEVLKIEDLPLQEPGPGEVRLRVKAIGLNRAEVMFRYGRYLVQPTFPSKIGYEASGIVEAVGEGVDQSWVGKVASTVPSFSMSEYGVYGEVAVVPVGALAEYPARLSFEQGTSIWMQYVTAYGALIAQGELAKGDYVLITAASSSVGLAAIEMVKAEGGVSIATTRTGRKSAQLLEFGADHVIAMDTEDVTARVMEITGGKGARLVFDPVGGPGVLKLAAATAAGGIIFQYGGLSGEATPYPAFASFTRHLWMKGYTLFELMGDEPVISAAKRYVYEKVEAGVFEPKIDKTFKLSEIVEAHKYMEASEQVGKIVVVV